MQEPFYQTNPNTLVSIFSDLDSPMTAGYEADNERPHGPNGENSEFLQRSFSISSSVTNATISSNTTQPNEATRVGYMRCLQIFFFHSSNLLLNRNNFKSDKIKNICCYTLEIYKLFIRKIKMDPHTWTMLITILLKVSEFIFNSEYLISNRNDAATCQLIKLITEVFIKKIFFEKIHSPKIK